MERAHTDLEVAISLEHPSIDGAGDKESREPRIVEEVVEEVQGRDDIDHDEQRQLEADLP